MNKKREYPEIPVFCNISARKVCDLFLKKSPRFRPKYINEYLETDKIELYWTKNKELIKNPQF